MPYNGNYTPVDASNGWTPIDFEGPFGLIGAETPGGRAVMVWRAEGRVIHLSISDPNDVEWWKFFPTDVAEVDIRTVIEAGGPEDFGVRMSRPRIMVIDGELILTVEYVSSDTITKLVVLVADDPDDPVVWTERGVISTATWPQPTEVDFPLFTVAGMIYPMDSGRWVYSGPWVDQVTSDRTRSGIWYSDDSGSSWTNTIDEQMRTSGTMLCGSVELEPQSGNLFFVQRNMQAEAAGTMRVLTSTNGASWSTVFSGVTAPDEMYQGFVNDGTNAYALDYNSNILHVHEDLSTEIVAQADLTPITSNIFSTYREVVIQDGRAYLFAEGVINGTYMDEPLPTVPTGWLVGAIAFGSAELAGSL